jgi:hypothetical protein
LKIKPTTEARRHGGRSGKAKPFTTDFALMTLIGRILPKSPKLPKLTIENQKHGRHGGIKVIPLWDPREMPMLCVWRKISFRDLPYADLNA